MKLVIGLGNPGERYKNNRHNVGFMVVDGLTRDMGIESWNMSKKGKLQYTWVQSEGEKVELIKPQTFVNDSGYSVAYAYKKHPELNPEDIYVIHDDLDIKLGEFKIQKGKGPKVHGGLLSIYEKLGKSNFWHVRVGVENRRKEFSIFSFQPRRVKLRLFSKRIPGERYVLQNFTDKELEILKSVIDNIVSDLINQFRPEDDQPLVVANQPIN